MNDAAWDVYLRRERQRRKREAEFRVIVWATLAVGGLLAWWAFGMTIYKIWSLVHGR